MNKVRSGVVVKWWVNIASRNNSKELTRNLKNEQSLKGCGCEVVGRYCCYPKNTDEKPIDIEDSQ